MKYKIEHFPNPERIQIHTTKKITDESYHSMIDELSELSRESRELVNKLSQVTGVTEISLERYSIRVEKAKCFNWQEMKPELIKVIGTTLAPNEALEELPAMHS